MLYCISHCVKSVQIRSYFWTVFSRIHAEYGEILRISPYSVRMRQNTDQKRLRIWTLFTQCPLKWKTFSENLRFSDSQVLRFFLYRNFLKISHQWLPIPHWNLFNIRNHYNSRIFKKAMKAKVDISKNTKLV